MANNGFNNNGSTPQSFVPNFPGMSPLSGNVGGSSSTNNSSQPSLTNPSVGGTGYINGQPAMSTVKPGSYNITPGLINQHPQAPTNTAITSHTTTTNNDGSTTTKQTYDPNAPANANAPGTQGNNGTNFQQNLADIQSASSLANNPYYNSLVKQQQGLITGQTAESQVGVGGQNPGGQSAGFNNQYAPQTTASLQGEQNIITPQIAAQEAGNAAAQSSLLQAGQLGTQGATAVAGFTAPQPYGITSTPYSPGTNSFGQLAGTAGTGSLAGVGSLLQTQQQGGAIKNMQGIQSQAQSLGANLSSVINSAGINPANASVFTSAINGINQWLNGQSGDPQYQNFANLITEVSSKYASILNQAGGTPTDQSQISHAIMNGMASGQSIEQVLGSLDKNATDSINALQSSANNSSGGANQNTNSSGFDY